MNQIAHVPAGRLQFEFSGTGAEYFRIWIVNVALTIVTLGIYSAWAKVRTNRYFYGNTRIDGHSFAYLAQPMWILRGRIIAALALLAYFLVWQFRPGLGLYALTVVVLLLPAAFVMASAFNLRNTAWRNIRFAFKPDIGAFYRMLGFPLLLLLGATWGIYLLLDSFEWVHVLEADEEQQFSLTQFMISVFILLALPLVPYLDCLRVRFIAERAAFGDRRMSFVGTAGGFYGIYLATLGLMLVPFMLLVLLMILWTAVAVIGGGDGEAAPPPAGMVFAMLIVFYLPFLYVMAFLRARRANLIFNSLRLGDVRPHSSLRGRDLGSIWITNGLVIACTLGLGLPWARVRLARYRAQRTQLEAADLESVTAGADKERTALGEEFGDMFGFDLGF